MEKRKPFTLFGLPGYSGAEWVFFILALIGISFTTITVVFQNEESVASTTIKKGSVNEEHKIPSTSSLRTDTEKTAESVSVSASEVGGTSKTKEKFETLNESMKVFLSMSKPSILQTSVTVEFPVITKISKMMRTQP